MFFIQNLVADDFGLTVTSKHTTKGELNAWATRVDKDTRPTVLLRLCSFELLWSPSEENIVSSGVIRFWKMEVSSVQRDGKKIRFKIDERRKKDQVKNQVTKSFEFKTKIIAKVWYARCKQWVDLFK